MARASLDHGVLRLRYIDWAAVVVEMTCKDGMRVIVEAW
jgi:hypothetical protein